MGLPVYKKPNGYSKPVKIGAVVMIVLYLGTVVLNADSIALMTIGELVFSYGIPTIMMFVLIFMMLFDITFRDPDT